MQTGAPVKRGTCMSEYANSDIGKFFAKSNSLILAHMRQHVHQYRCICDRPISTLDFIVRLTVYVTSCLKFDAKNTSLSEFYEEGYRCQL